MSINKIILDHLTNDEVEDKVIKQLNDDEKNELMNLIQEHQKLGE